MIVRFILNPYTISNSKREIVSWISSLTNAADTLVGMEATGGYESLLVSLLHEHGVALAVVNPRQVRYFAKGIGIDAKTDRIDATVLVRFAEIVNPVPHVAQSDEQAKPK